MNPIIAAIGLSVISSIVSGIIVFFITRAWIKRDEQKKAENKESKERVHRVLDKYMELKDSYHSVAAMLHAGVLTLKDDGEVRQVINLVVDHRYSHPVCEFVEVETEFFDGIDYLELFNAVAKKPPGKGGDTRILIRRLVKGRKVEA